MKKFKLFLIFGLLPLVFACKKETTGDILESESSLKLSVQRSEIVEWIEKHDYKSVVHLRNLKEVQENFSMKILKFESEKMGKS